MKKIVLAACALAALVATPALAKDARCFTTDDGYYNCQFKGLDKDGSFEIKAGGYPTFEVWMEGKGVASAMGQYEPGGRFVSLPGMFVRSADDPACWYNGETDVQICAW